MSRRTDLVLRFEIDLRPFQRALKAATRSIAAILRGRTPAGRLERARVELGGNGSDARTWPDLWLSAVCAAWLCGSCPSDRHGLGCSCKCHGAAS